MSTTPSPAAPMTPQQPLPVFDPLNQTFFLSSPQHAQVPVWLPLVDLDLYIGISTTINYGAQIGACFVMLLVVLTMTARTRFSRTATLLNLANLVVGVVRCTLLALYFVSSYFEFYTFFSGDHSHVQARDVRVSSVATFFALPQFVLIEAALFLQAYSMIQLWPTLCKLLTLALSAIVVAGGVAFKATAIVLRMRAILDGAVIPAGARWVQQADLAFSATTIFWFCFVFIIRLVLHMCEYRSILPPLGGVSAMEVLVMTNGILMLIPTIFAAMELAHFTQFESGSLTMTSVVILLPLGTLIAQSVTRRGAYISSHSNGSRDSGRNTGASRLATGSSRRPSAATTSGGGGGGGSSSKKQSSPLFGTWSQSSNATTTTTTTMTALVPSGGGATQVRIQSGAQPAQQSLLAKRETLSMPDPLDRELQSINAAPASTATTMDASNRVWVGHEVEVRHDMV